MKLKGKYSKIKSTIIYLMWYLLIISTLLLIAYSIIQLTLEQNVKTRTFDELNSKVKMQATMLEQLIDQEFVQLHIVERVLLSQNEEVESVQFDRIWDLMREKEHVTMLGFSDMSGNITGCNGQELGSIGEEAFFRDIVEGRAEEKCVLLRSRIRPEESDLLYAVPFYIEEEMGGVLFKSEKISRVEEHQVKDFKFEENESMFLVDSKGDILLVGGVMTDFY